MNSMLPDYLSVPTILQMVFKINFFFIPSKGARPIPSLVPAPDAVFFPGRKISYTLPFDLGSPLG
jgi:hypothetical protein